MGRLATSVHRHTKASLFVAAGLLGLDGLTGFPASAQTAPQSSFNLGGRGWGAAEATPTTPSTSREQETIQFSAKGGFASDYVYRGVTLSDRKPAVGGGVEASYGWLYAGGTVASVKLPTQPFAEFTFSGGVRPT